MAQVTLPIAVVSEHYANRQVLLVIGQLVLIGAQIMLMEARKYWLMVLARILQGASSSVIWVVGLALLYVDFQVIVYFAAAQNVYRADTVPPEKVGRAYLLLLLLFSRSCTSFRHGILFS